MLFNAVWVEVPVKDIERAVKFYSTIFEMSAEIRTEEGVRRSANLVPSDHAGIGASLTETANFEPSDKGPLVYIHAEGAIDETLEKIKAAGGSSVAQKTSMGPAGFYGLFKDTEGNLLALYSSI